MSAGNVVQHGELKCNCYIKSSMIIHQRLKKNALTFCVNW